MIKSKYGFTLAELMAVVVIVAILAAVALGSYRGAMQRSLSSDGITGAHTVAAAIDTYYEDHGKFPTSLADTDLAMNKVSINTNVVTGRNFTYTYSSTDKSVCADRLDHAFKLCTYLENGNNHFLKDRCISSNGDLCRDMGYTSEMGSWYEKP